MTGRVGPHTVLRDSVSPHIVQIQIQIQVGTLADLGTFVASYDLVNKMLYIPFVWIFSTGNIKLLETLCIPCATTLGKTCVDFI